MLAGGLEGWGGVFDPGLSEFSLIVNCVLGPCTTAAALGTGEAGYSGAAGREGGCLGLLVSKLVDHWPLSLADTPLPRPRGRPSVCPQSRGLPSTAQ